MLSINTSPTELILLNSLNNSTYGINNAIERLTTGYKINHAKDNAAGVSIVTQLSTKISSLLKIKNNTEDGISLLSTAQGALEEIQDQLARLRELSTQAMNGTYDEQSRRTMQAEADAIIENIKQIRNNTEFNGLKLFEGPAKNEETTTAVSRLAVSAKVRTMSARTAATYAANDTVNFTDSEGAITFAGKETKTLNICGITYTVTNNKSTDNSFSYVKDKTTGQITFVTSNFGIHGQTDVRHNIVVNGSSNIIYGGDLDDNLEDYDNASNNCYYAGDGNDTIIARGTSTVYGEGGNDNITIQGYGYCTVYGGEGDDTININNVGCTIYGGNGNDTFNINSSSNKIYGEEGDDTFNFLKQNTSNIIADGGSGNNIGVGTISANNYVANMTNANCYIEDFTGAQTKNLNINGINYEVASNKTATLIYKINNEGKITFKSNLSGAFTIKGQSDKAHNVEIASQINFYGGELNDTITTTTDAHFSYIYGMGGDDTITNTTCSWVTIDGGDGNDTITCNGIKSILLGGNGNDTINSNSYGNSIDCGAGDDNVTLKGNTYSNTIYGGGSGNNTLTTNNATMDKNLIYGFGSLDNSNVAKFAYNETKNIEINGINYSIKNTLGNNHSNILLYQYNSITNEITFSGNYLTITGQTDVAHNVILNGTHLDFNVGNLDDNIIMYASNSTIKGGNGNDDIEVIKGNQNVLYGDDGNDTLSSSKTSNGSNSLYGGAGDDTINIDCNNSMSTVNGGTGDDTYNINAPALNITDDGGNNIYHVNVDNTTIRGGENNDTFYIKGSNNNIITAGGDDYIVLDGSNNNVDGGAGTNYYVNNGVGNNFTNVNKDPNSGMLVFNYAGEVKIFEMDGITYTVTNQNADGTAPASNVLKYSYNPQTKTVTLNGSDFTVGSDSDINILNIRGDNNTINGGNGADIITVEQGSNNIINGLGGNDTLIMNSENNSLNGGEGDDTITLNVSTDKTVSGGNGNDTIYINSSNNANIDSGNGNDNVIIKGDNNNVSVSEGDNTITVTTENNNITAGNGDNHFIITGADNTISTGNGNNNIGLQSNSNTISTGNGNDIFEIHGSSNNISSKGGENEVNLRGDENTYQGGTGKDNIVISGNQNHANGGDANDEYMVSKGNGNIIDGEAGDRNTMINNGVNTQFTNVVDITPRPFELAVKVDLGSSANSFVNISISFNLFDFYVDFMNDKGLSENIEKIDDLLSQVNTQLLNIGTAINRLTETMEAQNIQLENMISTRSTLRDADVAKESSNFIKYQILQQASATLMATANQTPSIALALI